MRQCDRERKLKGGRGVTGKPSHTDVVAPLGEEIEESLADLDAGPLVGHGVRSRVSAGRRNDEGRRSAQERRGPRSPIDGDSSARLGVEGRGARWGQQGWRGSESRKGLGRGSAGVGSGGGGLGGVVAAMRG